MKTISTYGINHILDLREHSIDLSIDDLKFKLQAMRELHKLNIISKKSVILQDISLAKTAEIKKMIFEIDKMTDNLKIATKLNFIEPQTDLKSAADLNYRLIVEKENSLEPYEVEDKSNKLEIPLYMYGTKILSSEINIRNKNILAIKNDKYNSIPKMINLELKLKKMSNSDSDEFIDGIDILKQKLKVLLSIKEEVKENRNIVKPILIFYDTIKVVRSDVGLIQLLIIASISGLFAAIFLVNFIQALRKKLITD